MNNFSKWWTDVVNTTPDPTDAQFVARMAWNYGEAQISALTQQNKELTEICERMVDTMGDHLDNPNRNTSQIHKAIISFNFWKQRQSKMKEEG